MLKSTTINKYIHEVTPHTDSSRKKDIVFQAKVIAGVLVTLACLSIVVLTVSCYSA